MKTYITSVAGFQTKRQNKIQGFAKSLGALSQRLKEFSPRPPGLMKLFGCSHIFCTSFILGERSLRAACYLEPSLILLLFLFICICSVRSRLLPPALQLFLERRDSLNEFRWLLVVQQPVQQNRNQNEIWGWRGEYITFHWSAGVYCTIPSRIK